LGGIRSKEYWCHSVSQRVVVIDKTTKVRMSETEDSEYDDEDLSAPPRKMQTPLKSSDALKRDVDGDETQDEEDVQELSPSQFKQTLKRKQQQTPPRKNTNYAAIVRRSPNDDGKIIFCV
jgi:hypothetical protein